MIRCLAGAGPIAMGVLVALQAFSMVAHAADRVAVIREVDSASIVVEFLTRIEGELTAAGFQVITVDSIEGIGPREQIAAVVHQLHPLAVFGVWSDPVRGGADVWVADTLSDKTTVRHLDVLTQRDQAESSVLALRAVELLQGSLLDLVLEQSARARRAAVPVVEAKAACDHCETAGAAEKGPAFAVELGAATLRTFERVGPTYSPMVRIGYFVRPRFGMRLSATGFGTETTLQAPNGEAQVREDAIVVEAVRMLSSSTIRALVSLGAGAYHLGVRGSGVAPYRGTSADAWAAAIDGGGGARVQVVGHVALALELHALVTYPYRMVRIADVDAGRIGRPSVLGSLTMVGTW